jgi:taurine dioxygenase
MTFPKPTQPGVEVRPLRPFGAIISGVSVAESAEDAPLRQLRQLLFEFQLLVLRDQELSPSSQLRLTRCFGEVEPSIRLRPASHQVPGHPDVLFLSNKIGSPTAEYGTAWHSDGLAYARVPHGATVLHCVQCPLGVGDTLFADQYAAFDALPSEIKREVAGARWYLPDIPFSEVPPGRGFIQPLVRTHPVTGKRFLFCSPQAVHIREKTPAESAEILGAVHASQIREEQIYRHKWRPGDTIIWENCTLLHNRADMVDFALHGLRAMHRSATVGDFSAVECEAPPVSA